MAGRVRHPIDQKALERYIQQNVPEIKTPVEIKQVSYTIAIAICHIAIPKTFQSSPTHCCRLRCTRESNLHTQFGFGQSNPTYQLTDATSTRFVLRKKPPGKLLSKAAHKVEREHRIIHALGPTDVPVPKAYCLCEDDGIIGTPFYIMEFLDGRIIEDAAMPGVSAKERKLLWKAATQTLAKLHRVEPESVGLGSYGKKTGFYDRQIQTWSTICRRQAETKDKDTGEPVGDLPHFGELIRFFGDKMRQPRDRGTLIHGDFKIDNIVFHKTEPRVIGVLEQVPSSLFPRRHFIHEDYLLTVNPAHSWEMSTVGHPLSDLCNFLTPYYTAAKGDSGVYANDGFLPGRTPGLPAVDEIVGWYAAEAGWDPAVELNWGMAFSLFRLSGILQGIAARAAQGQASSEQAKRFAAGRAPLAEFAWELVGRSLQGEGGRGAKL
ncbi:Acyl-CoA dehydrogenase family member 11 [Colletotrichum trifolii]|uniref:Acyl-CoA dehydrogenase family member 11 n=1 Tax=Colletotrichum trifolii TaxID=5466 RepID=A0A4R8RFS8_COLTR|nr:Acyl-CoA dehydrogenase family member 11 [Colletotrichum trifolii]